MKQIYKLYDYLDDNGISVHFPSTKNGKCENPYVVLKDMGQSSRSGYNGSSLIHAILFTPINNYESMNTFIDEVKNVLKNVETVKFTGLQTPILPQDDIEAFTTSLEYEFKLKI